ncbi:hypothetical protein HY479_04165 [Candidatus Uhrbacteria bacterium]|nr:hypothetical protein [Candidatus Uhrbacteria bacterium]
MQVALATPAPVPPTPSVTAEPAAEELQTPVEVPPTLVQFLLSPRYVASVDSVKKIFKFSDDDLTFISDLDRLVMAGQLDLEAYLVALEDEFAAKLKDAERDELYAKLLAERFIPVGDLLKPTAQDVARREGLKLPATPHYVVYTKPLSYSGAATEVARTAGFSLMGGPLRERLRELIMSKVKGVRVDSQVRDVLLRKADFGGLGLDQRIADTAVNALNDILSRATVMSEDEVTSWLAKEATRKTAAAESAATPAPTDEEREIQGLAAQMPKTDMAQATELQKSVDATFARVTYRPPSDYLIRRLQNAISSRLRDVRSAAELKQLLMRDTKVGGLALDGTQADAIVKTVEESYREFHDAIAAEEKRKIETQLADQQRKIEERRRHEAEEHAKWYEERVRQRKLEGAGTTAAAEELRRVFATGPTTPLERKELAAEAGKYGWLVPAHAVQMTQPVAGTALPPPAGGAPPTPVAEFAKPHIAVSAETVKMARATAAPRPSVDAVKFAGPQLFGLVGELGSMTVAEFRRLAKRPDEAVKKIQQKIDTLSQESFEKRIEGIRAYQASPLQAGYMTLVAESFRQGKPVAETAEEKRKAGEDTLSPDEIAAIVSLNSTLHY